MSLTRGSPISLEELGADAVHFQEGHVGQEAGYLHPGAEHPSLNGRRVDRDSLDRMGCKRRINREVSWGQNST